MILNDFICNNIFLSITFLAFVEKIIKMTFSDLVKDAVEAFKQQFGQTPEYAAFAPGRVNLIGEHTDYNNGFVLPFALPHRTVIVASLTKNEECRIASTSKPHELVSFKANKDLSKGEPAWANYVKGTVFQYLSDLPETFAFDAVISSNVPLGCGLSSSAALE